MMKAEPNPGSTPVRTVSWLESIATEQNIDLNSISREDLQPSIDYSKFRDGVPGTFAVLEVDLPEHLFDIARGLEYRIGDGPWENFRVSEQGQLVAYLDGSETKGASEVFLQIDENAGPFSGTLTVGPFSYELAFQEEAEKQETARQTREERLLSAKEWISHDSRRGWHLTEELLAGEDLIAQLSIYTSPRSKSPVFRYPQYPGQSMDTSLAQLFAKQDIPRMPSRMMRVDVMLKLDRKTTSKITIRAVNANSKVLRDSNSRDQFASTLLRWRKGLDRSPDTVWGLSPSLTENDLAALTWIRAGEFPDKLTFEIPVTAMSGNDLKPYEHPVPTMEEMIDKFQRKIAPLRIEPTIYLEAEFVDETNSSILQLHGRRWRPVVLHDGQWKSAKQAWGDQERKNGGSVIAGHMEQERGMPEIRSGLSALSQKYDQRERNGLAIRFLTRKYRASDVTWIVNPKLSKDDRFFVRKVEVGTGPDRLRRGFVRNPDTNIFEAPSNLEEGFVQFPSRTSVYWQVHFMDGQVSPIIEGYRANGRRNGYIRKSQMVSVGNDRVKYESLQYRDVGFDERKSPEIWTESSGIEIPDISDGVVESDQHPYVVVQVLTRTLNGRSLPEGQFQLEKGRFLFKDADKLKTMRSKRLAAKNELVKSMFQLKNNQWSWNLESDSSFLWQIQSITFGRGTTKWHLAKPSIAVLSESDIGPVLDKKTVRERISTSAIPDEQVTYVVVQFLDGEASDPLRLENKNAKSALDRWREMQKGGFGGFGN